MDIEGISALGRYPLYQPTELTSMLNPGMPGPVVGALLKTTFTNTTNSPSSDQQLRNGDSVVMTAISNLITQQAF